MDDLELLVDLHLGGHRQGPGSDAATRRAIELSGLSDHHDLRIADIGCGTGASTIVLVQELDARTTAVDLQPGFLARLGASAAVAGFGDRIDPLIGSMDALPFHDASFDAIWSEGAIYNVGFETGVRTWRRLLRPGGILAVSELTWLTHERPSELDRYWSEAYPEVDIASAKMALLERHGFTPVGYFPLDEDCWMDNYYTPMRERSPAFLERHAHSRAARDIVEAEEQEITLYERFSAFVGYGYYVARRHDR